MILPLSGTASRIVTMTASQTQAPYTLYRGWPSANNYVWSPFVIKLETRLRFAGVPYKTDVGGPRSAPKGKIPYLVVGDETLADTALIVRELSARNVLRDLNEGLSAEQRALDLGLRTILEDKLCFYHVSIPPTHLHS
jgi:glutathione S-transferase